jgi:hypothetical protein
VLFQISTMAGMSYKGDSAALPEVYMCHNDPTAPEHQWKIHVIVNSIYEYSVSKCAETMCDGDQLVDGEA